MTVSPGCPLLHLSVADTEDALGKVCTGCGQLTSVVETGITGRGLVGWGVLFKLIVLK